jgi:hypothetical protein
VFDFATFAVMLAYLAGYLWLSRDVHAALRTLPIQPTREAVLIMRPTLDPFAEENRGILTASCERILVHYDPNIQVVLEKEQLLALLEEADRTDRPLYLSYGRPWLARRDYAELMEMVEREDLFEPVTTLYGFEPRGLMRVFRYRGR